MNKAKILMIEDNEALVEMYNLKLTREGFSVITAFSGEEGIQKAIDEKPDLILLDILMPNMDGFEVLKIIRNNTSLEVPIIILSNLGQQEQIEKGYQLGATAYLVKANFTPLQAVEKIKEFLAHTPKMKHYLLKLTPNSYDYEKLLSTLPAPIQDALCPSCYGEIALECFKTNSKEKDTWLKCHFICTKCGKTF